MPFLRIDIDAAGADIAAVEEACLEAGACAVTLVDRRDDPVLEPAPGEVRLWPATGLQVLFGSGQDADWPEPGALLRELQRRTRLAPQCFEQRVVEDRVWEREWLRDFQPMAFGARLWIVPTAYTVPPQARAAVRLDPGLAFGTGTHPTTAMCLRWLDAHLTSGEQVIDYGCGSGVLALAALVLGARDVQAFDIDSQALLATEENARLNAVHGRLRIAPRAETLEPADIVLANILAGPLAALAPNLAALVRPGGFLVLAGLLEDQAADLQGAYRRYLSLRIEATQAGWVLLAGQRPADAAQFRP